MSPGSAPDLPRVAAEVPQLKSVRLLWLPVTDVEKYLLLEDKETGDVLLPLIYMKSVFEANYSRKLSSLKHRLVMLPTVEALGGGELGRKRKKELEGDLGRGFVYWQWAFEAFLKLVQVLPPGLRAALMGAGGGPFPGLGVLVKVKCVNSDDRRGGDRTSVDEPACGGCAGGLGACASVLNARVVELLPSAEATRSRPNDSVALRALGDPQGHLRLILLPIVYNAMAQKQKLPPNVEAELAEADKASLSLSLGSSDNERQWSDGKVFNGPYDLYSTLAK
eukprot:jgi/Mesen1/1914/ME000143S00966